jgi:hypothetical protein
MRKPAKRRNSRVYFISSFGFPSAVRSDAAGSCGSRQTIYVFSFLDYKSHVLAGEGAVWEELLGMPFDFREKGVIVVGIVVCQEELPDAGELGAFDRLQVAGMAPSASALELLGGVLGVVEEEVGSAAEVHDIGVQIRAVLYICAEDDGFSAS